MQSKEPNWIIHVKHTVYVCFRSHFVFALRQTFLFLAGIIMATCDAEETSIQIGDVDITLHYQTTLQETTVFKDCPSEYKGNARN